MVGRYWGGTVFGKDVFLSFDVSGSAIKAWMQGALVRERGHVEIRCGPLLVSVSEVVTHPGTFKMPAGPPVVKAPVLRLVPKPAVSHVTQSDVAVCGMP